MGPFGQLWNLRTMLLVGYERNDVTDSTRVVPPPAPYNNKAHPIHTNPEPVAVCLPLTVYYRIEQHDPLQLDLTSSMGRSIWAE